MSNQLSLERLKDLAHDGLIDTVIMAIVDMQGRLMGKRFHVSNFLEKAHKETHCCNYLLATDMNMITVTGYAASSWSGGYGDYTMKPDMSTLRCLPWLDKTAFVLCDTEDHATHQAVPHAPREILKQQIRRLAQHGYQAMMSTELEFFLFEGTADAIRKDNYHSLSPISGYNEDYHIFQTTKEELVMQPLRNGLVGAGIAVESTKGEAEGGQGELNVLYSDALNAADNHVLAKHATKEIAWQKGYTASFLAKWNSSKAGSAAHIHQSLWDTNGNSVFYAEKDNKSMSTVMRHYLAGLTKYLPEYAYFMAPYINSYKRFQKNTFAPVHACWSSDNRTAGFRICGQGTTGVRIECRIPGSDINPYLAMAAQLAAGLKGIEDKLSLEPEQIGDAYQEGDYKRIPTTLLDAAQLLKSSAMLREAMGDAVIEHYYRAAEWELEDFNNAVTDYEIVRGLERA